AHTNKLNPVNRTLRPLLCPGVGLYIICAQIVSSQNFKPADLALGITFGSFFVLIGSGLIFASIKRYGLLKKQVALQDANPLSPWLWRADWASRRAERANKKSYITAWIAATFVNLITAPFMLGKIPELL